MERSRELWRVPRFDLMMVHNMMDWRTHLKTLQRMKEDGRVRYIGITTSHGRRHEEMESVIRTQPFDFVQFTYNLADRDAEPRLLPAALDKGKAVIINRPFDGGALFRNVTGFPLPGFAKEIGCHAQKDAGVLRALLVPLVRLHTQFGAQLRHCRFQCRHLTVQLIDVGLQCRDLADGHGIATT
jgi:aryl-alcohol dehydrogenase-like predicted oxidoreductase